MDDNQVDIILRLNDELTPALQRAQAAVREAAAQIAVGGQTGARGFNDMRSAYQQFDNLLAAGGVHIGQEVKGLFEIGDAAKQSAGKVGLLGTAGLALGAGLAGWKLGRMVADFFDLDTKIGNATAKLLGYGDVAGEVAGAKQDVINLAISHGADAAIKYAQAIEFNVTWTKKHTDEQKASIKAHLEWAAAAKEVDSAGKGWLGTLMTIDGETVEGTKFYLEAGIAQGVLASYYGLTDVQVKAVASSMEAEKEKLKKLQDYKEAVWRADDGRRAIEKEGDEIKKARTKEVNDTIIEGYRQTRDVQLQIQAAEDQTWMDATDFQVKQIRLQAQEEMASFKGREEQRAGFNTAVLTLAEAQIAALYAKDVQAANQMLDLFHKVQRTVEEEAALTVSIIAGTSGLSNDEFLKLLGQRQAQGKTPTGLTIASGGAPAGSMFAHGVIQSRDFGGAVSAGRPYWIGTGAQPEVFIPKSDGMMYPSGAGGVTVVNHNYITQPFGSPDEIAQAIDDAQTARYKARGVRF